MSNDYSAEYGHTAGGVISLTTRSGTNEFHGSIYEFLRNSAFDARNFFAAERPPVRLHQFGAALGGPIRRDGTHFFGSGERTRQLSSTTPLQTVPTPRSGRAISPNCAIWPATSSRSMIPPRLSEPRGSLLRATGFRSIASIRWRRPHCATSPSRIAPAQAPRRTTSAATATPSSAGTSSSRNSITSSARATSSLRDIMPTMPASRTGVLSNSASRIRTRILNDVRVQNILGGHAHIFSPSLVNDLKVSFLQRRFVNRRYGADSDLAGKLGLNGRQQRGLPSLHASRLRLAGWRSGPCADADSRYAIPQRALLVPWKPLVEVRLYTSAAAAAKKPEAIPSAAPMPARSAARPTRYGASALAIRPAL